MLFVLAKIVFTPLLLAVCTFVAHRWGDSVGGWLLGLPITSGPVSVFLFAEHGSGFAETAARATLLGLVAGAVFCACYSFAATRMRWWQSLGIAYGVCLATAWMFSLTHLSLTQSLVLVVGALALLAVAMGAVPHLVRAAETGRVIDSPAPAKVRPAAGLVARMLVASASVIAITAVASLLGPSVGGLLAPLPVLAAVMAASSLRRGARSEAHGLLRGAVVGSWGGAAFFAVVAMMLTNSGPLVTYGTATAAALVAGAVAMGVHESEGAWRVARGLVVTATHPA